MKIIGIIVEFNPLHEGHLNLINKIKNKNKNCLLIAAMSGDVVQRGEFAIFNKFQRTKSAIEWGVDLVVVIPSFFVLNNANIFAKGAIEILEYFQVQKIIFGSEENNIKKLKKISDFMDSDGFDDKLKKQVKIDNSFPKAFNKIIGGERILSNDILGICYINEAKKLNSKIIFQTIKRDNKNFKTASSIREEIKLKNKNNSLIKDEDFILNDKYQNYYFSIILTYKGKDDLIIYLRKILLKNSFKSWENFLDFSKNKTFTKKRINREVLKLFLNIKEYNFIPWVLGSSNKGKEFLRNFNKKYTTKRIKNNSEEIKIEKIIKLENNYKEFNKIILENEWPNKEQIM